MKLVFAMVLFLCAFSRAHAEFDPNNPFADECGESSTAVLPFFLAANSADQVLCLNDLTGNVSEDRKVAFDCFLGNRVLNLVKNNSNYSTKAECTARFIKHCVEVTKCQGREKNDQIFGGTKLFCGHLGAYLDFFWRVKGGLPLSFSYEDGLRLCTGLVKKAATDGSLK